MITLQIFPNSDGLSPYSKKFESLDMARKWLYDQNYNALTHGPEILKMVTGDSIKFKHELVKME
jgi:hypothetical protein